ncbi:M3 family metallopeptidase [Corynebacterium canis]|uniref:M3 family metallopeptidase n=1 Tax=Corynebacterium canis TaxID=679663 RepID=A0A5C5USH0_9CORY|nr:M3 family metallopeptidase [Corynebacterium canis]TWT28520.1 M3 family metallopeptidase [Corynebacterium canis]WJY75891.1 Peptidyl-dipeptidase dcp [Corynebacterium canis]
MPKLADNPLLTTSNLPYQLPPFADINESHFRPAFEFAMAEHAAEIAAIVDSSEPPTWENTVEALERAGRTLSRVSSVFFNLDGTDSSDELNDIAAEITPKLSAHTDAIYQNAPLYQRIRQVSAPEGDAEGQRLHEYLLRAFRRRGADLSASDKAELSSLNERLSVLAEQFGRNLLASTKELAVGFEEAELEGFSPARVESAAADARALGRTGFVIPLELPTVQAAQTDLVSAQARAKLYAASQRRGVGTNDEVLLEMVRLRARRAQLLGYRTHADYVIEEETAGTAEAARKLLFDLAPAAAVNAAGEYKLISDIADGPVTGADWPYWESQLRARDYALDEETLRQYFPLNQVLRDGVFYAANRLYGITVIPREDLQAYGPDIDVWEVLDANGEGIGLFITDYYGRPSKRGGAWMSSFVEQSHLLGTKPVIINVMGVTKPADGSQALLTLDEVTTLFHEFGHALHGLLSDVRYPTFAGTSVPRDYVEFPSQINENWALDAAVVRNYARHVETGEVIPDQLLAAIEAAKLFGQGFGTSEYLAAAIIDLAWHSLTPEQADAITSIADFEQSALQEAGLVVDHLKPRYQSTYFNHVFGGGYAAGYYSYLWAEALDADGFGWFTEQGATGPGASVDAARAAGQRFRDLILSRGASRDYNQAFEELRGRAKDVTPLLKRRGLDGVAS